MLRASGTPESQHSILRSVRCIYLVFWSVQYNQLFLSPFLYIAPPVPAWNISVYLWLFMQNSGSGLVQSAWVHVRRGETLTWWLGKIKVSATTTFSLRPAVKTTTSAISSGVKGSHPLCQSVLSCQSLGKLTHRQHRLWTCPHRIWRLKIPVRI